MTDPTIRELVSTDSSVSVDYTGVVISLSETTWKCSSYIGK